VPEVKSLFVSVWVCVVPTTVAEVLGNVITVLSVPANSRVLSILSVFAATLPP
jgi:hypothetical protein